MEDLSIACIAPWIAVPNAVGQSMPERTPEPPVKGPLEPPTEPLPTAPAQALAAAPHARHWGINAIFVLAVIVGVFAVLAVWVNRQVLNTDNWTNTSSRLLADPKIEAAVGNLLVNELFSSGRRGQGTEERAALGSRRARGPRGGRAADARDPDRAAGARDRAGPERLARGQPHGADPAPADPQRRQQDDLDEQRRGHPATAYAARAAGRAARPAAAVRKRAVKTPGLDRRSRARRRAGKARRETASARAEASCSCAPRN